MFKDPDLFELGQATRQAIYQAAQADLDRDHNLSRRDAILNHAEREFKTRLGDYISHLDHKSEQDSATILGQALHIASLLDQVSELVKENKELTSLLDQVSELVKENKEPTTDHFVQKVPDKCDRIVWRGKYIHLDNC